MENGDLNLRSPFCNSFANHFNYQCKPLTHRFYARQMLFRVAARFTFLVEKVPSDADCNHYRLDYHVSAFSPK